MPFHALPGTNSGMPKLSSSVELLMLTGLLSLESGQPELPPPLDQGPLSSSRLGELAEFLAPGALENSLLSLLIIWRSLDPPGAAPDPDPFSEMFIPPMLRLRSSPVPAPGLGPPCWFIRYWACCAVIWFWRFWICCLCFVICTVSPMSACCWLVPGLWPAWAWAM